MTPRPSVRHDLDAGGLPSADMDRALREAEEQGRRAQASYLLGRAWEAWDLGDAEGVLALIGQARSLAPLDLEMAAWMDEAEAGAREQVENARFQRVRGLLREGDVEGALRAWPSLSPSSQAEIRRAVDTPELGWVEQMASDPGRVEAAIALRNASALATRGEVAAALELVEPFRTSLAVVGFARDFFEAVAPPIVEVVRRPTAATRPSASVATSGAIAALASHIASGGNFKVDAPSSDWALHLALALRDLLPGKGVDGDLTRIQKVIDGRDAWKGLPAPLVVRLIELLAARLRTLQPIAGVFDRRVDHAFSCLTHYSKREKPGFAYGLMRDHRPRTESWESDADVLIDEIYDALPVIPTTPKVGRRLVALEGLVAEAGQAPPELREAVCAQIRAEVAALLADGVTARNTRLARIVAPVAEELSGMDMRTLRRAARALVAETEGSEDEAEESPVPAEWAWWTATRGKRAVMVGGDPREPNRVRLEQAFGFAELAWEHAEHSRNSLQKVRDRVRSGGVDLVFILTRFVGHDADEVIQPACRDAGVPFVPVKSGYGVAGIRLAIERFLQAEG